MGTGKSRSTSDQEPPVTKRSINPSGSVEGCQPCAGDRQQGRGGRSQVHQEDQDVSQAFQEVRRVRVEASKGVDEAKKVQEEDRSRQNSQGYWLVFGDSINAVLEPIGIAFLEDIFSGMERAWKRFTAWVTNIEGYMGGFSWQHLFPELYGAGSSILPCSSQEPPESGKGILWTVSSTYVLLRSFHNSLMRAGQSLILLGQLPIEDCR